jgi:hypothetical protein
MNNHDEKVGRKGRTEGQEEQKMLIDHPFITNKETYFTVIRFKVVKKAAISNVKP